MSCDDGEKAFLKLAYERTRRRSITQHFDELRAALREAGYGRDATYSQARMVEVAAAFVRKTVEDKKRSATPPPLYQSPEVTAFFSQ